MNTTKYVLVAAGTACGMIGLGYLLAAVIFDHLLNGGRVKER